LFYAWQQLLPVNPHPPPVRLSRTFVYGDPIVVFGVVISDELLDDGLNVVCGIGYEPECISIDLVATRRSG
jgi:hypothetical protein